MSYDQINITSNLRFERKFLATAMTRQEVIQVIKKNRAFFREIYHPRQINNIYLDTNQLRFFYDNKKGIANRKKIRIRWYGNTFGKIEHPKLEYKIKEDLLGDKWTFDLNSFEVNSGFHTSTLSNLFANSNLPTPIVEDLKKLQPTLLNTYRRTYFQSANKHFRLTLDEHQTYYRFDHPTSFFKAKYSNSKDLIIELKYQPAQDAKANNISNYWPYRLSKNSKYVNGIDCTRMRGRD